MLRLQSLTMTKITSNIKKTIIKEQAKYNNFHIISHFVPPEVCDNKIKFLKNEILGKSAKHIK